MDFGVYVPDFVIRCLDLQGCLCSGAGTKTRLLIFYIGSWAKLYKLLIEDSTEDTGS